MAVSRVRDWQKGTDVIPASTSKVVDTIPLSQLRNVNYFVNLFKGDETQTKTFKMSIKKEAASLSDTIYARLGTLQVATDALVSGSNLELRMTNTEIFPVEVRFFRNVL